MSVKTAARGQYQQIVDATVGQFDLPQPPEGWLRTARKALGMSGAQVAKRMGVTRARVAQAEQAELSGGATLHSMRAAAAAMGCRFVYAVVPKASTEAMIAAQAHKKAKILVGVAGTHMALESQTLTNDQISRQTERLARDLAHEMPADFWNEP